ncbi:MAG: MmgE/PrpD family protein [Caulobacterales bacterium]|uniref:MmgE/PrpD family protein n=1 Tax=Glycocaulis sp. TaxID=1969725 RepID=UPI003FA07F80
MSGQILNSVAAELAGICAAPVSEDDRSRAALHVLDWAACAIAGSVSEQAQILGSALRDEGAGHCTVIGARSAPALSAIMINGALGNVLEMDDVDKRAILHPGPVVIPAALAACEMAGGDATAFLDAVVRGYEAVIRVGRAVGPGHYAYWHNTGTCGPFGAAMAAASAFGLKQGQAAHALALAGTQSSGLWQTRHDPASMAKQLHTARAAHAGLLGARLAAGGFTGPLEIFEGVQGFFAATCPGADPSAILAHYDGDWRIHEVSFKPWPACRHAHAAIDAALSIRDAVSASEIAGVTVETYSDALAFCDRPRPQTVLEAKFSLQHSVAVSLLRGKPQIFDFEPDVFGDPHIRLLAGKTAVETSSDFNNAYPARYGARVTITDRAGKAHTANVPDALGDPENPLSVGELEHKAMALCAQGRISPAMAARVCETALALASGGDLEDFVASLPAAGIRGVV